MYPSLYLFDNILFSNVITSISISNLNLLSPILCVLSQTQVERQPDHQASAMDVDTENYEK